jgi:hypothetical protein
VPASVGDRSDFSRTVSEETLRGDRLIVKTALIELLEDATTAEECEISGAGIFDFELEVEWVAGEAGRSQAATASAGKLGSDRLFDSEFVQ